MNILLISANTEQINMPVLPLGMACIAAAAESRGHGVRLVNLMAPEDLQRLLPEAFAQFSPDLIGITVRNIDDQRMRPSKFLLPAVKTVIDVCRSQSSAPILLGGAGFSIFAEQTLDFLEADFGIQGEGEAAFLGLLDRLGAGQPVQDIAGLWVRGEGLLAPPDRNLSLNAYPLPQPESHLALPARDRRDTILVPFQTRRGCPMRCSYCSTPAIEGTRLRMRHLDRVVENLKRFVDAGCRKFFFVDNTFNLPPGYAKSLCTRIAGEGLGISWQAIVYPTRVDEEMVRLMAAAGCEGVSLGFESGAEPVLAAMNKKYGIPDICRVADLFGKYGIARLGFLLLGGPGETRETARESFRLAKSLDLESVKLSTGIRIYPNTALAAAAMKKGIIGPQTNLLYPSFYMEPGLEQWLLEKARELAASDSRYII
ncbi:B12-binding domain-containing radical SAM protein [Desulfatirhabdium butyrativorans]|uniref:B12-binding domain-containing radical SAM protein n=1 Tax=Desulfatirhabdium butyrativorans TaxID=340467 RepID=UPI00042432BF|nr:B12-binding domain-containing radical SAM protein [Desulfatirhabdium butyrativorans]